MSVSLSGIGVTQPNLYLFQYIKAYKPLLTLYHLKPISSNLYWPSTSQYRHILIQYHQVPLLIHHLDRHSSANWIISLFTTHLMSHAQYTWSSSFSASLMFKLDFWIPDTSNRFEHFGFWSFYDDCGCGCINKCGFENFSLISFQYSAYSNILIYPW